MKKIVYLIFIVPFFVQTLKAQIEAPYFLKSGVNEVCSNYGGKEELKRIIDYHLNYPEKALKAKKEGIIDIKYICDAAGNIVSYKLINSIDPEIDLEAERIFKMLLWHPAIKDEITVDYESYISIPFSISKYRKSSKRRNKENQNPNALTIENSNVIYDKTDKAPVFIYGMDSLLKFVASELEYPQEAKTKNIEGTVVLNFIVEPNGFISNLEVKKELGGGCQEEAIRIIGQTKWYPAIKDKQLVRCKMSYSVVFKLQDGFHDNSIGTQRLGGY